MYSLWASIHFESLLFILLKLPSQAQNLRESAKTSEKTFHNLQNCQPQNPRNSQQHKEYDREILMRPNCISQLHKPKIEETNCIKNSIGSKHGVREVPVVNKLEYCSFYAYQVSEANNISPWVQLIKQD